MLKLAAALTLPGHAILVMTGDGAVVVAVVTTVAAVVAVAVVVVMSVVMAVMVCQL